MQKTISERLNKPVHGVPELPANQEEDDGLIPDEDPIRQSTILTL